MSPTFLKALSTATYSLSLLIQGQCRAYKVLKVEDFCPSNDLELEHAVISWTAYSFSVHKSITLFHWKGHHIWQTLKVHFFCINVKILLYSFQKCAISLPCMWKIFYWLEQESWQFPTVICCTYPKSKLGSSCDQPVFSALLKMCPYLLIFQIDLVADKLLSCQVSQPVGKELR